MGELRVGVPYRPSGIDPHVNSSELAYRMFANVFDPLVWRDRDGGFVPGLAESWGVADDGRSYHFSLRRGVTFHDGTPLTAEVVKASFDRIADPATHSQAAKDMLGPYAGTDVQGERDLVVRLTEPFAPFLDAVSQAWLAPVSRAAVLALGDRFGQVPVGTGPFKVLHHDERELVLEVNPDYAWAPTHLGHPGVAHLSRVVFRYLPDAAARVAALRTGTIHVFYEFATGDLELIAGDHALVSRADPIPGAPVGMMMNTSRRPTSDLAVRQAITRALDIPELVRRVFGSSVKPATAPLASTTAGYEPLVGAEGSADPASAGALLDLAGWVPGLDGIRERSGTRLSLVFCALPHAGYAQLGAEVGRQLRPLGIEVDVRVLAIGDWLAAGDAGTHHLIPVGKFAYEPDVLEMIYHSRHVGHGYAWSWCRDDRLDAMLTEALRSLDPARRTALFRSIQARIVELALVVPLHENVCVTVLRPEVTGFAVDLRSYPLLYDVRLATAHA